jgi:hypothetical protein
MPEWVQLLWQPYAVPQFRPIIPHVADLGGHFPRVNRTGIRLHHLGRDLWRAAHPVVKLAFVQDQRHSVVVFSDVGCGCRGDDGKRWARLPNAAKPGADSRTVVPYAIGAFPKESPETIDAAYVAVNTPIVREQLQKAGVRLAHLLDAALGK